MLAFREYDYSKKEFIRLQTLARKHCGIDLRAEQEDIVYGRLSRRLRALKLNSFSDYCCMMENDNGEELEQFTNALTTNLTAFFREPHHFQYLRKSVVPEAMKRNAQSRRLRIWSAGCSTGEEPYSIAMALLEAIPNIENWDVRILATDLDTSVIDKAICGIYPKEKVDDLHKQCLKTWFQKGNGSWKGMVRVAPRVCKLVSFRRLNLMDEWPMKGPFDIIFCRNVVIYFDRPTQQRLFDRYARIMAPEGHLFIGHSESLYNVSGCFKLIGRSIYRRSC